MLLTCLTLHSHLLSVPRCLYTFMFHRPGSFSCLFQCVLCYFTCVLLDILHILKSQTFTAVLRYPPHFVYKDNKTFLYIISNNKNTFFHFKALSMHLNSCFCPIGNAIVGRICKKKNIFQRLKYPFIDLWIYRNYIVSINHNALIYNSSCISFIAILYISFWMKIGTRRRQVKAENCMIFMNILNKNAV